MKMIHKSIFLQYNYKVGLELGHRAVSGERRFDVGKRAL